MTDQAATGTDVMHRMRAWVISRGGPSAVPPPRITAGTGLVRLGAAVAVLGALLTVACASAFAGPNSRWATAGADQASGTEPFGVLTGSFIAGSFGADGTGSLGEGATPDTQAGDHPYQASTSFAFNTTTNSKGLVVASGGYAKDTLIELPPGFVGDPNATPYCQQAVLVQTDSCPNDTAIGVAEVRLVLGGAAGGTNNLTRFTPVYNMAPSRGELALFGFDTPPVAPVLALIHIGVRTTGDYGVTARVSNISQLASLLSAKITLWGVPADPSHDPYRGNRDQDAEVTHSPGCLDTVTGGSDGSCPSTAPLRPLLTNPTLCDGRPLMTTLNVDSWEDPGNWKTATADSPAPTGCGALSFDASLSAAPSTTVADSPTGLTIDLHVPQNDQPYGLATPELRKAVVTLPAGLAISPSSADGLEGCTPEQIGIGTTDPVACPEASKLATVVIHSPSVPRSAGEGEGSLSGFLYLGKPASGSITGPPYTVYLVAEGFGVSIRLAGKVVADPVTGQLTTTFAENPPLPFDDLKLDFFTGPRAPLATPDNCGSYATRGAFSPWSGTAPVATSDSFDITSGCNLGFTPSFSSGSTNPVAGSSNTAFTLSVKRPDGQQHLKRVTTVLPPGLLAKVAGVPLCPDPQATAGTCDSSSQIGTTTASAGPGPSPFFASGKVFLTGPYNGGPYGLSIVVPAVAGPFDLGRVVVRTALIIDKSDGHVTAVSDDIPGILQGIPLRIRSIAVQIDRPGFILNPTNCNPMQVRADVASSEGAVARVSNRFQVGDCASLPFRPSFSASTQAHANLHGAALDVKVSQRPGEAAIHKVDTQLPLALPSRLVTLQKACAEAQFAANPAGCPPGSDVGIAKAITPILNAPLTGPAYLVSHGGAAFPDLDIVLQGDGVTIVLAGNTDIKRGITYSRFEAVPDAPISSFELYLPGGPGALLAATRDLCAPTRTITASKHVMRRVRGRLRHQTIRVKKSVRASLTMPVTLAAQNGAVVRRDTAIAVSGCRSHMPKRHATPKRAKHPARRG